MDEKLEVWRQGDGLPFPDLSESEKAQLGYTPNAALAAISAALEALTEAQYVTGNATADATAAVAMATPVDPSSSSTATVDGVTTTVATCVVPAGDGEWLDLLDSEMALDVPVPAGTPVSALWSCLVCSSLWLSVALVALCRSRWNT